jgi:S-DNA-T family DNA segregation ATPase FtsK/SpoIIIE
MGYFIAPALRVTRGSEYHCAFSSTSNQWVLDPSDVKNYQLPGLDLLDEQNPDNSSMVTPEELLQVQATVIEALAGFGLAGVPGDITCSHAITCYELHPAKGVRVDKIVSLERDIARVTCAERINILVPSKDTVGIEIANSHKPKVTLRELMESEDLSRRPK